MGVMGGWEPVEYLSRVSGLAEYQTAAALKDGAPVWVRAIRPDDRDILGAAFAQLSERTVYHRFFQSKTELTTGELWDGPDKMDT